MKKILLTAVFLMVAICVSISIGTSVSYVSATGATEIEQVGIGLDFGWPKKDNDL